MSNNYKEFVKYICIISVVIFGVIVFILYKRKGNLSFNICTTALSYTSIFMVFLSVVCNQWVWRISFVGKYLHTPDISGIWEGKGKSSFNDTEFDVKLKIKQTFLETHIHGDFDKSQSDSFSSNFIYDGIHNRTYLIYSYQNDPKLEYRNKAEENEEGGLNIHYGTTKLEIDFNDLTHLNGTYWNDRKCIGTFELTKRK